MVSQDAVCCFTGHQDIQPGEEQKILTRVRYLVMDLLAQDVLYYGVGGARGFDMLAAEFMLHVRDQVKNKVRVISVLPYPGYMDSWTEDEKRRQEEIIRRSDKVVWVSRENRPGVFHERDRKLVDGSGHVICYCRRVTGGTAYTVRYAMEKGIPVMNASSWDLRQLGRGKRQEKPGGRRPLRQLTEE